MAEPSDGPWARLAATSGNRSMTQPALHSWRSNGVGYRWAASLQLNRLASWTTAIQCLAARSWALDEVAILCAALRAWWRR